MTLKVRTAGIEAAALFAALHAAAVDDPWGQVAFAEVLGMSGMAGWLATGGDGPAADGKPLGFLLVRQVLDEAEVILVAVDRTARRKGAARTLLRHALNGMEGVARVFLEVASDNPGAIALYRDLGFSDVGRRRGYYARPGGQAADAHVLGISLPFPCRTGA